MDRSKLMKFFSAYLHGAFAASILYLCVSRPLSGTGATPSIQVALLIYWLLVACLFGLTCAAILRGWPFQRKLRYFAFGSLAPALLLVIVTKVAAQLAA
ncbi:hypothetical protein ASD78_13640 [Lysobacter sp. Root667]|nr:hypothetical protein ASD78_13640 [Lysobacter sp. Root667]